MKLKETKRRRASSSSFCFIAKTSVSNPFYSSSLLKEGQLTEDIFSRDGQRDEALEGLCRCSWAFGCVVLRGRKMKE